MLTRLWNQTQEEVDDLLLNQLSKEIRKRDLTPRKLIELADMDNDGMLDSNEIAGALSAQLECQYRYSL